MVAAGRPLLVPCPRTVNLRSRIESAIKIVPDFPIEGLPFRDVTPIFEDDPLLFRDVIDAFVDAFKADRPDCIVCVESFGYVFGVPVAYLLGTRLVLARRAGKLPREVHRETYEMVYATERSMEVHKGAIRPGDRVLIIDDVLASGGSALAAVRLVEESGGTCIAIACVADMRGMPARQEIESRGIPIFALASLFPGA